MMTPVNVPAYLEHPIVRLVRAFAPERIILFGSRAKGSASPDSDADLLVVADLAGNPQIHLRRAHQLVATTFSQIDVVFCSTLTHGTPGSWDAKPLVEVLRATVEVDAPAVTDEIIARYADPERLAWMHANFTDASRVAELDQADSYATRLYDYARAGRDQIAWVIDRIKADPAVRNATITTFQPLTDTSVPLCSNL